MSKNGTLTRKRPSLNYEVHLESCWAIIKKNQRPHRLTFCVSEEANILVLSSKVAMKISILSAVVAFLCLGVGDAQEERGPVANLAFPYFRYRFWSDLTNEFKRTARNLQYNNKKWELPFANPIEELSWSSLGQDDLSNATLMGYDEDVWDCYQNHYDDYDWSELKEIGVHVYFKKLGWNKTSWNEDTVEPAPYDKDWDDLTAKQQAWLKEICYFREEVWDEETFVDWVSYPHPPKIPRPDLDFPFFRYEYWTDLADSFKETAKTLQYNKKKWELPFENAIEDNQWYFLEQADQSNAALMGYDEYVWDCYQNHYDDYFWIELQEAEVATYFEVFGWDEDGWNDDTVDPELWDEDWEKLTADEKAALKEICYFREEIWDEETFADWVSFPPKIPRPDLIDLDFPFFRYQFWTDLTKKFKRTARFLQYNNKKWELPFTNGIEDYQWSFLLQSEQSKATLMGYDEYVWDCYQNHYDDYYWIELQEAEVAPYFEVFGWDEVGWNEDDVDPELWDEDWKKLTADEKAALKEICYFREEVWEEETFADWSSLPTPSRRAF
jgi:hypothetical protein